MQGAVSALFFLNAQDRYVDSGDKLKLRLIGSQCAQVSLLNLGVCRSSFVSTETKRNVHGATAVSNALMTVSAIALDAASRSGESAALVWVPCGLMTIYSARQALAEHRQLR